MIPGWKDVSSFAGVPCQYRDSSVASGTAPGCRMIVILRFQNELVERIEADAIAEFRWLLCVPDGDFSALAGCDGAGFLVQSKCPCCLARHAGQRLFDCQPEKSASH